MLSKESKRVAIAPFPGLGRHPSVGRRHLEVTGSSKVCVCGGGVRCFGCHCPELLGQWGLCSIQGIPRAPLGPTRSV